MLTNIDVIVFISYLVILLFIGYKSSKKSCPENFLIAERKLGVIPSVATINASKTGSIIVIFTAFIYSYGISAILYFVGIGIGYLVFIPFASRVHRLSEKKYYTLPDYFYYNYGKLAAIFASIISILVMLASMIINMIAASKVCVFFTGLEYTHAALIVSGVVLVYLLFAGFKAVVATDLFQYLAIIAIFIIFAVVLGGSSELGTIDLGLGEGSMPVIVGFFLLGVLAPFAQPELWQRIYAMPDVKVLRRGIFYSVLVYMLVALVLTFIALCIKSMLPGIDPDTALIQGLAELLPEGMVGLAVVIFFSAMMSSIDTYAYTAASNIVQDFFKSRSIVVTVFWIRIVLVVVILLGTVVTINFNNLVGAGFILAGFMVLVSLPAIYTWINEEAKPLVLNLALPISLAVSVYFIINNSISGTLGPSIIMKSIGISLGSLFLAIVYCKVRDKLSSA